VKERKKTKDQLIEELAALRRRIAELEALEAGLKEEGEDLLQSRREVSIRNRIAHIFLDVPDDEMYAEVLQVVLEAMKSEHGVFGYIDEAGDLVCPSMTKGIWDLCQVREKDIVFPRESWGGIWGRALIEKKIFLSNEPFQMPEGHVPIHKALTLPIMHQGEVIGIFAVGNKTMDYSDKDRALLETIADYIAPILHARLQRDRQERDRKRAEEDLQKAHDELERRVEERTLDLSRSNELLTKQIEERKQAEETLCESEARFRLLFENSPDAIFVESTKGYVLDVNPTACQLHGLERKELIGKHVIELVPPGEKEQVSQDFPKLARGELDGVEGYSTTVDGRSIPVELRTRPIVYSGKPAVLLLVRDITRRKQAEEALRKSEEQLLHSSKMEAVGRLAGGMAHDFNNLMTAVTCYSELLLDRLRGNTSVCNDIEEIKKAGERAASLTRQLLAFSRRQIMEQEVLDVNTVVAEMERMLRRLIGEDIEVNRVREDGPVRVKADRGQIEQVIMNMAINAKDAMPSGGRLTIKTETVVLNEYYYRDNAEARPGNYVCLSVDDTGAGMSEGIIQNIFEPFFTTKGVGKGTGLGLSVAYGIIKQHEGWISVASEPGRGTSFKVYLPLFSERSEEEAKETIHLGDLRGNGERILVVEDEEGVREMTLKALSESGYTVLEASTVKEAMGIFEREKGEFHLIFSDVVLPDESGIRLIDRLLALKPGLPVILSSGYMDDKLQWPVIKEKGFRFLQKPYTLSNLLRAVKEAMEGA